MSRGFRLFLLMRGGLCLKRNYIFDRILRLDLSVPMVEIDQLIAVVAHAKLLHIGQLP